MDVLLGPEVDAEPVERPFQGRHHRVRGEAGVPLACPEEPRHVGTRRVLEPDADAPPEEGVDGRDVEVLRLVEEAPALAGELVQGETEALVERAVRGGPEAARRLAAPLLGGCVAVRQVLFGELDPDGVEPRPARPLGLVGDGGLEHPEGDLLAVDLGGQRGLEAGDLLRLRARQVAEVALAREPPELDLTLGALLGCGAHPLARLERRQIREALVDGLELEGLLVPREVEVVLLVERGDEPVGLVPVRVKVTPRRGRGHAVAYPSEPCERSRCRRSAGRSSSTSRSGSGKRSRTTAAPPPRSCTSRTRPPASRSTRRSIPTFSRTSRRPFRRSWARSGPGSTSTPTVPTRRRTCG